MLSTQIAHSQTTANDRLSQDDRAYIASQVYSNVHLYFNLWSPGDRAMFESRYKDYLRAVLSNSDRAEFDLRTIELMAQLHNGHTWFDDRWLQKSRGAALGFYAEPVEGQWTVVQSQLAGLEPGSTILKIDDERVDQFFNEHRSYLGDSNERAQRLDLFRTGYLFPKRFVLTLSDQRKITVTRGSNAGSQPATGDVVTARWLKGSSGVAYMKIRSFGGVRPESEALKMLDSFKDAQGMIIDLRGNPGGFGNSPRQLQSALMTQPFPGWLESSGKFVSPASGEADVVSSNTWGRQESSIALGLYPGQLVILIDGGCASFCEDFVMPFKMTGRARLIGEATQGTFSMTHYVELPNGMRMNIAATKETFPDGSKFEGVGIKPDIEVPLTIADIRTGTDTALSRAAELLGSERH